MTLEATPSRALDFLLEAARGGFRAAWDLQPNFRGTPLLMGTVFPLSIIATVLARPELGDAARKAAVVEAETIASLADDSGWRYFNLYPAIPPDADDLATATRLLLALDWPGLPEILETPLQLVRRNAHPEGGFHNWLADDPTQVHELGKAWVAGPDPRHPETTANLLEILCRCAPDSFEAEIRRSIPWLLTRRQPEGWASWWYYGWAYGTMMVLRAFKAMGERFPDLAPTLAEAAREAGTALLSAQSSEGSWSPRRTAMAHPAMAWDWTRPSVLETALATTALAELGPWAPAGTSEALERAVGYLQATQHEDGGWSAEPFYLTLGMSPYANREVTTALALEAMLTASSRQAARR